jgi:hypothetical protein
MILLLKQSLASLVPKRVNLSRALTQFFKVSNDGKKYCNLSIGRATYGRIIYLLTDNHKVI